MEKIVRRDDLAFILGISQSMVNVLVKDGMPKESFGKYNVALCVQWRIDQIKRQLEGDASRTIDDERKQLVIAQTHKTNLEADKLRGEMIPIEEVSRGYTELASAFKGGLEGLPARLAALLAETTEPAEAQKVLFDGVREVERAIARTIEDFAALPDSGGDSEATAKPKRRKVGQRKQNSPARKPRARTVQK